MTSLGNYKEREQRRAQIEGEVQLEKNLHSEVPSLQQGEWLYWRERHETEV